MSSWSVEDWCTEIIEGSGGLQEYKYHEIAQLHPDPRIEGAIWALKCVSNPGCEGSDETLKAIEERRNRIARGSS